MITKNEIKRIKSLQNKKDRKELQLFVAEGEKTVRDLLKSGCIAESIYVTESFGNVEEKLISSKEIHKIITKGIGEEQHRMYMMLALLNLEM